MMIGIIYQWHQGYLLSEPYLLSIASNTSSCRCSRGRRRDCGRPDGTGLRPQPHSRDAVTSPLAPVRQPPGRHLSHKERGGRLGLTLSTGPIQPARKVLTRIARCLRTVTASMFLGGSCARCKILFVGVVTITSNKPRCAIRTRPRMRRLRLQPRCAPQQEVGHSVARSRHRLVARASRPQSPVGWSLALANSPQVRCSVRGSAQDCAALRARALSVLVPAAP